MAKTFLIEEEKVAAFLDAVLRNGGLAMNAASQAFIASLKLQPETPAAPADASVSAPPAAPAQP